MIPVFEKAVTAMNVGDTKTVKITANEAYGAHRDELVIKIIGLLTQIVFQRFFPRPGFLDPLKPQHGVIKHGKGRSSGREFKYIGSCFFDFRIARSQPGDFNCEFVP